ncbi:hypothetical protein ABPG72_012156 [Tetrahymena utriculariae]
MNSQQLQQQQQQQKNCYQNLYDQKINSLEANQSVTEASQDQSQELSSHFKEDNTDPTTCEENHQSIQQNALTFQPLQQQQIQDLHFFLSTFQDIMLSQQQYPLQQNSQDYTDQQFVSYESYNQIENQQNLEQSQTYQDAFEVNNQYQQFITDSGNCPPQPLNQNVQNTINQENQHYEDHEKFFFNLAPRQYQENQHFSQLKYYLIEQNIKNLNSDQNQQQINFLNDNSTYQETQSFENRSQKQQQNEIQQNFKTRRIKNEKKDKPHSDLEDKVRIRKQITMKKVANQQEKKPVKPKKPHQSTTEFVKGLVLAYMENGFSSEQASIKIKELIIKYSSKQDMIDDILEAEYSITKQTCAKIYKKFRETLSYQDDRCSNGADRIYDEDEVDEVCDMVLDNIGMSIKEMVNDTEVNNRLFK